MPEVAAEALKMEESVADTDGLPEMVGESISVEDSLVVNVEVGVAREDLEAHAETEGEAVATALSENVAELVTLTLRVREKIADSVISAVEETVAVTELMPVKEPVDMGELVKLPVTVDDREGEPVEELDTVEETTALIEVDPEAERLPWGLAEAEDDAEELLPGVCVKACHVVGDTVSTAEPVTVTVAEGEREPPPEGVELPVADTEDKTELVTNEDADVVAEEDTHAIAVDDGVLEALAVSVLSRTEGVEPSVEEALVDMEEDAEGEGVGPNVPEILPDNDGLLLSDEDRAGEREEEREPAPPDVGEFVGVSVPEGEPRTEGDEEGDDEAVARESKEVLGEEDDDSEGVKDPVVEAVPVPPSSVVVAHAVMDGDGEAPPVEETLALGDPDTVAANAGVPLIDADRVRVSVDTAEPEGPAETEAAELLVEEGVSRDETDREGDASTETLMEELLSSEKDAVPVEKADAVPVAAAETEPDDTADCDTVAGALAEAVAPEDGDGAVDAVPEAEADVVHVAAADEESVTVMGGDWEAVEVAAALCVAVSKADALGEPEALAHAEDVSDTGTLPLTEADAEIVARELAVARGVKVATLLVTVAVVVSVDDTVACAEPLAVAAPVLEAQGLGVAVSVAPPVGEAVEEVEAVKVLSAEALGKTDADTVPLREEALDCEGVVEGVLEGETTATVGLMLSLGDRVGATAVGVCTGDAEGDPPPPVVVGGTVNDVVGSGVEESEGAGEAVAVPPPDAVGERELLAHALNEAPPREGETTSLLEGLTVGDRENVVDAEKEGVLVGQGVAVAVPATSDTEGLADEEGDAEALEVVLGLALPLPLALVVLDAEGEKVAE